MARKSSRIPVLLVVVTLAASLTGPVAVATVRAVAPSSGVYLVITPPWLDPGAVISAANGREVGVVQPAVGRVVQGRDAEFVNRLWKAGAWLVLSDPRLLALCGVQA
jgi:hypothetical protein